MASLEILYEDNHLLVVNKPAEIATMGADGGPTIHSLAAEYLKRKYNKPGRAYVGIVSRLDAMTSGVLVLARTSKAAARLTTQFGSGKGAQAKKIYLAALEGELDASSGTLVDQIFKDDAAHRMRVARGRHDEAKEARLRYRIVGASGGNTIAAIQLLTGRKHQIRVQFADRGHGVLGDRKYGSRSAFASGIALHSWQLQIVHPTLKSPMRFRADPPSSWTRLCKSLPPWRQLALSAAIEYGMETDTSAGGSQGDG